MTTSEAFFRLGISVTKDIAGIKKAYQAQLPGHHPEEDPQGFMRLHQAYKTALAYAQGNKTANHSTEFSFTQPAREETDFDRLFSHLEEDRQTDLSREKKGFTRKILWMRLHWLPISLKSWKKLFTSEAYLLCRGEAECMERLLDLMVTKIHTYPVFRYLLDRLWELVGWQHSEGLESLAQKTQACINEMCRQYSHYLELNQNVWISRLIQPVIWYYQALPFYFKMLVSIFLVPVIVLGSGETLILLLLAFYAIEIGVWIIKLNRQLGFFHPRVRKKNGRIEIKNRGNSGYVVIAGIYAMLIHMACCMALMESLSGF